MLSLIKPLIVNITILFSLTFNANLFLPFHRKAPLSLKQQMFFALIGSFGALLCMSYPIETLGDTNFDLRMISILIVTLYAGWLPGALVVMIVSLVRASLGGEFLHIGVIVTVAPYVIAVCFRPYFIKGNLKLLKGTIVVLTYFLFYIFILYTNINFLPFNFYVVYFLAFYCTYIAILLIIEQLMKTNKQFDEMVYMDKLTTIGQMAASIAHEIRNPITTVRGFIQFIQQDTKDEKLKRFSPLILEELDRTNKIITDYLKLAKPNQYELSKINIDKVLKDSIELMRPFGSYSNVTIEFHSEEMTYVKGDIQHLKQSLLNIIKNAIEAMEHGGVVKITKKVNAFNSTVTLKISDQGKGMTKEELNYLGLPFYTTKSKGTGLGSMITNRLILEMGGTIEYESKVDEGTIVTITLKLETEK
ncbi:ATP-binding protein [Metabacillus herbersteinensis]|uniref:histidine kinase n=1 Tax=Metabacillus herbersteinensis TaxID=283816 RepID=A0ABV6GAH8_9BACI